MKLCDLDKRVIVPVVDETRGGIQYEMQMSIGELLKKALEDFEPEIIEAVPVKWLNERHRKCCEEGDTDLMDAITVLCNEYHVWQKEREGECETG